MRATGGVLVGMLLLVGCSNNPGGSASGTPSLSASASAVPSGTAFSVQLIGSRPVVAGGAIEGKSAALPAALVFAADAYHAFLIGFGETRGDERLVHASSPDGVAWTIDEADPLAGVDLGFGAPGPVPTSVLELADGTWAMYLWGTSDPSGRRASIWRATAPAVEGPWTADPEPVLTGDPDGWDSLGVDSPSVLRTPTGYLMAFVGASLDDPQVGKIGFATSTDGIVWTKRADPVIVPGHCGGDGDRSITQPRVMESGQGYLLAYAVNGIERPDASMGLSMSMDGTAWTCAVAGPLIEGSDLPGSQGLHTFAVAAMGEPHKLLIESLTGDGSELWLAELNIEGS